MLGLDKIPNEDGFRFLGVTKDGHEIPCLVVTKNASGYKVVVVESSMVECEDLLQGWKVVPPSSAEQALDRLEKAEVRIKELEEALRYARRFLRKEDHDTEYLDEILGRPFPPLPSEPFMELGARYKMADGRVTGPAHFQGGSTYPWVFHRPVLFSCTNDGKRWANGKVDPMNLVQKLPRKPPKGK